MAVFNWDQSYSVNVRKVDEQHQKLFDIINQLVDSMREGRANEALESTATELLSYTKVHFREEEAMLRATGYASFADHEAQHKKFENMVEELKKALQNNGRANSVTLLQFLKDWLANHIKQTDKQYSAFVNAKGYR